MDSFASGLVGGGDGSERVRVAEDDTTVLQHAFFGLARVASREDFLGRQGLPASAPAGWVEAGEELDEEQRDGKVVALEFLGLLPVSDPAHVARGAMPGTSYGVAAVSWAWWSRAVGALGCPAPAPPEPGVADVGVPYLVMRPGYAVGKLHLAARCSGGWPVGSDNQ